MRTDPLLPALLDEISAERAEIEPALAVLQAERPALAAAAQAAKDAYFSADQKFQSFQVRLARATRHGAEALGSAGARLAARYRAERDSAGAAMTRAVHALENLDWRIGSLRGDLGQLELIANPPSQDGPRVEIVKRPPPAFSAGDFEIIEMPFAGKGNGVMRKGHRVFSPVGVCACLAGSSAHSGCLALPPNSAGSRPVFLPRDDKRSPDLSA